jgi:hypothetical protein
MCNCKKRERERATDRKRVRERERNMTRVREREATGELISEARSFEKKNL